MELKCTYVYKCLFYIHLHYLQAVVDRSSRNHSGGKKKPKPNFVKSDQVKVEFIYTNKFKRHPSKYYVLGKVLKFIISEIKLTFRNEIDRVSQNNQKWTI